jgi:hypothetical protein
MTACYVVVINTPFTLKPDTSGWTRTKHISFRTVSSAFLNLYNFSGCVKEFVRLFACKEIVYTVDVRGLYSIEKYISL